MKNQRTQELARTIGKQIAKARGALGITQEEAAERIGITVEYYARLERGQSLPSLLTFAQMSVALEVSAESLMSLGDIAAKPIAAVPPPWYSAPQAEESKQLRRLFRRLRSLPPELVAAAESVVKQLERFLDKQQKKTPRDSD
jgi:transcriptional regulator with XRE-family HTH domain